MFLKNWRGRGRHPNIYLLLPEKCFSGQLSQFSQNSPGFSNARLTSQEMSFFWANKSNWSPMAQTVKNLPVVWETWVWSLGWEDSLEKRMATHPSIIAWRIPWTEEPGRLQSMGSQRVGQYWGTNTFTLICMKSESESHSLMPHSLWSHELYSLWNSSGQNTGMGSLSLLQRIFPTQGLNPGLPHCRQILYQLSHRRTQECWSV